jgi:hypothetical protein
VGHFAEISIKGFTAFATSVREYVRVVGHDPMIHREAANAINGLVDFLKVEGKPSDAPEWW